MGELLAQVVTVRGGVTQAPEGIQTDDVEGAPVHPVQGARGVADRAGEEGADGADDVTEESVDLVGDGLECGFTVGARQNRDAVVKGVAGQVPAGEQAQFAAGDQNDVSALLTQSFGSLRTVGEVRKHLFVGHLAGERREPDLQPDCRGVPRGGLDPVQVAARDADRGAVQVLGDDLHVPRDGIGVEERPGGIAVGKRAGVVVDALASHALHLR